MRDEMNHNTLAVTGTPTLVAGALTEDADQALTFVGPTSFASAVDSTSLSITGSLSIELFVNLSSLPGSTLDLVRKTGSYAVQVDSSGQVLFVVTGASSNVTVTSSATISTGVWHHLVCVYNGNYAGTQRFGKSTLGSSSAQVDDDNGNNKAVSEFTLVETALLQSVSVSLQYVDEIWPVQMCAVIYSDDGEGVPERLVTKSDVRVLNLPMPAWRNWTWVTFPLTPAVIPAGTYHLGYVADTVAGIPKAPLVVGREASGGTTTRQPDSVDSPSDPFNSIYLANTDILAAYCDYSAVGRTGDEGKALIYINGFKSGSAVYAGGIADTSNALEICPAVTASVDEVSIWNKALTSVQIATHYTAH